MSIDMAFQILDFIFKNLQLDDKFHIYFWGGEPFLNFKVIKAVIEKYPQFLFHTNTNGGIITEEIYEFINNHKNFAITWSFGNCYEKYKTPKEKVETEKWIAKLVCEDIRHNINFMIVQYDKLKDDTALS